MPVSSVRRLEASQRRGLRATKKFFASRTAEVRLARHRARRVDKLPDGTYFPHGRGVMAITYRDPLEQLQRELDRMLESAFRPPGASTDGVYAPVNASG